MSQEFQAQQSPAANSLYLATPGPGEPYDGAVSLGDIARPLYGATFGQSIGRFFRNYANFTGRASRSEYWWAQLFIILAQVIPAGVWLGMYYATADSALMLPLPFLGSANVVVGVAIPVVVTLVFLVPSIALAWRRLHDANLAGAFWLLTLTSIGGLVVFVLTLLPPSPEGRRFDAR